MSHPALVVSALTAGRNRGSEGQIGENIRKLREAESKG